MGNERLSHCCKSDEMLYPCVQFKNSNFHRFKLKKITVMFQIIVCLMNWQDIWNRKNILIIEKYQKEHWIRTVKT